MKRHVHASLSFSHHSLYRMACSGKRQAFRSSRSLVSVCPCFPFLFQQHSLRTHSFTIGLCNLVVVAITSNFTYSKSLHLPVVCGDLFISLNFTRVDGTNLCSFLMLEFPYLVGCYVEQSFMFTGPYFSTSSVFATQKFVRFCKLSQRTRACIILGLSAQHNASNPRV